MSRKVMRSVAAALPKRGNNAKIANMGPLVDNPAILNQDVAPTGGFPPVRVRRNLPNKFWSIGTFLFISTVVMGYGWYRYYKWIKKRE